jgi:hypothetical protein
MVNCLAFALKVSYSDLSPQEQARMATYMNIDPMTSPKTITASVRLLGPGLEQRNRAADNFALAVRCVR